MPDNHEVTRKNVVPINIVSSSHITSHNDINGSICIQRVVRLVYTCVLIKGVLRELRDKYRNTTHVK